MANAVNQQAFDFDGKRLHVRGEIVLDKESAKISDAVFTSGWHDVCIVTESDTQIYSRLGPLQPHLKWTPRRTFPADSACISSGTLYATESCAVVNVDLGTLERKTEQRLEKPTAGDNLCPYGPNVVFVADSELLAIHHKTDNQMMGAWLPKQYPTSSRRRSRCTRTRPTIDTPLR